MDITEKKLGGLFTLSENSGINASEKYLAHLCSKSFLSLWHHPNTYRKPNKELIDVLIVFGDDVILFSDKHSEFNEAIDTHIAWSRWCRKAIEESAGQLQRACEALIKSPENVFIDVNAKIKIPATLPPANRARYHLVATARGANEACSKAFGGDFGSLIISTKIERWDSSLPFFVGSVNTRVGPVHFFDADSISIVLQELDTISDFVAYLEARREFLFESNFSVISSGEEQLLATYMQHRSSSSRKFVSDDLELPDCGRSGIINFDDTHAAPYFTSSAYKRKKDADRISYIWDDLINSFVASGNPGYVGNSEVSAELVELALRAMASEDRFARRSLGIAISGLIEIAERSNPSLVRFRISYSAQSPDCAHVFAVVPILDAVTLPEYRQRRFHILRMYCVGLLAKNSSINRVIGLGFEHPLQSHLGSSEDVLFVRREDIPENIAIDMLEKARNLGFLKEVEPTLFKIDEYPRPDRISEDGTKEKDSKKNKGRKKQQKRSRRKNR